MPLPYPHRATFLASTLVVPAEAERSLPYFARLMSVIVFDHLVRHPMVTLGDDDERIADENGRLLDASHPQIEDNIDWLFRVSRRHEVLWLELGIDRARPTPTVLRARRAGGAPVEEWASTAGQPLSRQLAECLTKWLTARRLPQVGPLADFTADDLRNAGDRLAFADSLLRQRTGPQLPPGVVQPLPRLAIPYVRVLAELARDGARTLDPVILELDPTHPVARRNAYVAALIRGETDRRAILPLVAEAPMYAKPHLSIWGEPFAVKGEIVGLAPAAGGGPVENMGIRHQGIAAGLMPANPYACHNYSLQLADASRREESYRWADRATVAAPQFGAAHLDCVRRLRQLGRPGQAFAEAQYRCREILDRATTDKLSANDWQAPHHAALLIAFAHLDVGRIQEAIELADEALVGVPDEPAAQEAFAWAVKRISHWKTDAGLLARAYAWEGYHRGDVGRTIVGLTRGRITDDDDAQMLIESLVAVGREEQAELAVHHCAGMDAGGLLADGKARLAAANAMILSGDLDGAIDHIQTTQLRRSQSRLEAHINRALRLAAIRPANEWERVIERRIDRGAVTLAKYAARDLADFVPNMDTSIVRKALGERRPITLDQLWVSELIAAVPAAQSTAGTILGRLMRPVETTLRAADALAEEWWTVLVPPARDRDAHAGGAVLALGISLANYMVAASGITTPLAGAYRHIATEALHLVRRARYQIEPVAIAALLRLIDRLGGAPEWLLDTWLLRVERALDLEAEHGGHLDSMIAGLPTVGRLLRGDERIGWELRMAHDLAADASQYEPAANLFERCTRAVEGGGTSLAWSTAAAAFAPPHALLDVHWIAAIANPTESAAPWLRVASALLATGRNDDGFEAACRGMSASTHLERDAARDDLAPRWRAAGIATPIDGDAAFNAGLAAASEDRLDIAIPHLKWAAASEPGNAKRAQSYAVALARVGHPREAIKVLAAHERNDAPRLIGRVLVDSGRDAEAVAVLRYASRRFRSADDWAMLASAAARADNAPVAIEAGRRALVLGSHESTLLVALATGLYRLGEFVECEQIAQQLIADRDAPREVRIAGLHAMARALAGQGRHVDAHPYAKEAARLGPNGDVAADLIDTMERIVAQTAPAVRPNAELSMERSAFLELELGRYGALMSAIGSPSFAIARAALAACEVRTDDESGIPVSPRALEAAVMILGRTEGATQPDAVLARVRALRIRDNAFIQIDPPPPMGTRYTPEDFERAYAERDRRPHRPSAVGSFSR